MTPMTPLKEAYENWTQSVSKYEKSCCAFMHDPEDPDINVCLRERAWRKYVRLRDNLPEWPKGIKATRTNAEQYKSPFRELREENE